MKHHFEISTDKLHITPLYSEDIESLRVLRNRDDNRKWFFSSELITEESQRAWYESYLTKPYEYMFSVKQGGMKTDLFIPEV